MIDDDAWMAKVLALAERGKATTSPNPMVGALVVDADGVVVGRGAHRVAGGPHAEVFALDDAGLRARGATLYCSLEPCSHTGRTGPCAPRVVAAGIRRAVIAMGDPNPLVAGGGIAVLRAAGIETRVGVREGEAARLNAPFVQWIRRRRPFVIVKVALSIEGHVAAAPGTRTALTSVVANRRVQRDRAWVDAIAVGSGTVLADNPLLTARAVYRARPLVRVVFDRRLRTPPTSALFSTLDAGPVIIVTAGPSTAEHDARARALAGAGAEIVAVSDGLAEFPAALEELGRRGITSLLVEGGPALHRALRDAGLVDRVQMYVTGRVVGRGGVPWLAPGEAPLPGATDVRVTDLGCDTLVEADVHRVD